MSPVLSRRPRPAFTLVELLVVIAIIALLVAILLPGLCAARCTARGSINKSNLRQYGSATQSYSSDFQDRIWAFTWRAAAGGQPRNFQTQYADLANPADDIQAAHYQAVDIFRRRAPNRDTGPNMFPTQGAWIPHIYYSHLVMLDYLAARLPEPMVRSPEDRLRAQWAEDPLAAAAMLQAQGRPPPTNHRWPYSSSYTLSVPTFTADRFSADGGYLRSLEWGLFQYAAGTSFRYRLGNRRLSDILFPGNKVHVYETIQFTCCQRNKPGIPFIHPTGTIHATTFAGSVSEVRMNTVNKGGYTLANASPQGGVQAAPIDYTNHIPAVGDPPYPGSPTTITSNPPYFRHTIGGLKGIDVGTRDTLFAPSYPGFP